MTGDYLGVFPRNHPELVTQYAERLGLPLDTVMEFNVKPDTKGTRSSTSHRQLASPELV
jgi:sulfite reductase alpha subunit-like flavoprotein